MAQLHSGVGKHLTVLPKEVQQLLLLRGQGWDQDSAILPLQGKWEVSRNQGHAERHPLLRCNHVDPGHLLQDVLSNPYNMSALQGRWFHP